MLKRILIIGSAGAGKTALAKKLSKRHDLPLVSLDHLFWRPGWQERPQYEFERRLRLELKKPRWVMDGTYLKTLPARLLYAERVVYLDFRPRACMAALLARRWQDRPEQAPGCPANLNRQMLSYVLREFPRRLRPALYDLYERCEDPHKWVILKSRQEVRAWLEETDQS